MEMLLDHQLCKDKFLVQSVVVRDGATMVDFVPELFVKAPGRLIEEFKLRVVYIAAYPPSPVPEEEEEGDSSPRSEARGGEEKRPPVFDAAPTCIRASGEEPSCVQKITQESDPSVDSVQGTSVKSRMAEERECAVDEKRKLQYEMELFGEARSSQQGFSLIFVVLVFMSSVFIGHLMNDVKV